MSSDFNFLRSFTRLLRDTEVPPRFSLWCGIALLLAALERRVHIRQGPYTIYPNFFMILIAASGQKKSTPINLVDKLLRRCQPGGPNVVAQKVSPESLIASIKTVETTDTAHLLAERCGGIVIADELATFLDRSALDRGLGPVLTKLYDCSPFEYETLKRGKEKVENGYLSILGGTTVELLRNCLPKDAIGGGFTSRTLFIYEDKRAPPVAWVDYDETLMELEEALVLYLTELRNIEGEIRLEPDAKKFYIADYNDRYYNGPFAKLPLLKSYENRRHTFLWKIAMAIMVAEDPGLVMKAEHLAGAKVILEEAEIHMPKVIDLIIASDVGAQTNEVLAYIRDHDGRVPRSDLMRHFGHKMDALELSKVIDTLVKSELIGMTTESARLVYVLKENHK